MCWLTLMVGHMICGGKSYNGDSSHLFSPTMPSASCGSFPARRRATVCTRPPVRATSSALCQIRRDNDRVACGSRKYERGRRGRTRTDGRAHLLTFPCKASRVPTPPERSAASPSSRANRQNRDAATQQPFVNPHLSIQDGIRSHHGMIRLPLIEKFRIQCLASA